MVETPAGGVESDARMIFAKMWLFLRNSTKLNKMSDRNFSLTTTRILSMLSSPREHLRLPVRRI